MTSIVIYTDMDGSLLDHGNYSHQAADALLAELEAQGIPVVPVTSKTRAELLHLRLELNNHHPFIIENGAAVVIPRGYFRIQPAGTEIQGDYWVKAFSRPRSHWLKIIEQLVPEFADDFDHFAQLDTQQIASLTGLNPASAKRAAAREYGEPLHWHGKNASRLRLMEKLHQNGAHVLQGGRFLHVSDACNKGDALLWLNNQYGLHAESTPPTSIAIGDSQNDAAMLEVADHALLIPSPAHPPPTQSRTDNLLHGRGFGPIGWDEGVRRILQTLYQHKESSHG